ncbi:hypothetical protein K461DRAFT_323809 [Myriangium duriaei CBS 260.36]|uniref:DUF7907 domain-containing protein n=1 Tax=Myriangium duriaei CBS 260.36 TaxID=1168546 RepID=A0A9P4IX25_9PEZI|nr:hypothetical protein K461DRAFT_323809 [Myriangium duriaei CBS 260.36]
MHSSLFFTSLLALASSAVAALNNTQEFTLIAEVKPGQAPGLGRFNGLELVGYHSGAGLNDAVFLPAGKGNRAFFNVTDPVVKQPNGEPYYNLIFDLGSSFPYAPQILNVDFYAEWLPVAINAGNQTANGAAWYTDDNGLEFTSSPTEPKSNSFGGWLVCDWFRGVPQLFSKLSYYNSTNPSSCADINLRLNYI